MPSRHVHEVNRRRTSNFRTFGDEPFTVEQALNAGAKLSDLRSDVVHRVIRGVYASAHVNPADFSVRARAYALVIPDGARIAHISAARLYGLPVPKSSRIFVHLPQGARFARENVVILRGGAADRVMLSQGNGRNPIPVTAMEDLVPECADRLTITELVVLADAILARIPASRRQEHVMQWSGNTNALVRHTALSCAAGAESPMETLTRLLLIFAGLPCPQVQYEILVNGTIRRFDLAYPEWKVAVEYDGSYHYASEAQKQADLLRDDELRSVGWRIVRVVSAGIYRDPRSTVRRVEEALRERGADVRAHDGWRQHFGE